MHQLLCNWCGRWHSSLAPNHWSVHRSSDGKQRTLIWLLFVFVFCEASQVLCLLQTLIERRFCLLEFSLQLKSKRCSEHICDLCLRREDSLEPRLAKWHRNLTLESESRVSILCLGTKLVCHRWSRQRLSRQTANESLYVYLISIASRIWFSLMDCKCNRDWRPGLLV